MWFNRLPSLSVSNSFGLQARVHSFELTSAVTACGFVDEHTAVGGTADGTVSEWDPSLKRHVWCT